VLGATQNIFPCVDKEYIFLYNEYTGFILDKKVMFLTGRNVMANKVFVDSNVWVYLFSAEDHIKSKLSEQFIATKGSTNTLVVS